MAGVSAKNAYVPYFTELIISGVTTDISACTLISYVHQCIKQQRGISDTGFAQQVNTISRMQRDIDMSLSETDVSSGWRAASGF